MGYWDPRGNAYSQPPGSEYAAAPQPQSLSIALVAIAVVALLVLGAVGYFVGGSVLASSRLSAAQDALAAALSHQVKMKGDVTALSVGFLGSTASSATPADISQEKDQLKQVLDQASTVLSGIESDDAALASADSDLLGLQWLTWRSKSSLDAESAKVELERQVLGQGITITSDYILLGDFYQALLTIVVDMQAIQNASNSRDVNSTNVADEMLKADVDKAIQQDGAPGLPADVDPMLHAIKQFGIDFGKFLYDGSLGDIPTAQADLKAAQADAAKTQSYDFKKMGIAVSGYYAPLVDKFNALITKVGNG
ncbi:MAG: hypothetical protein ACHQ0J_09790 [Candidatus Dormibacterales bacterium]